MIDSMPLIFFGTLLLGVFVWFVLHRWTLKKLARDHSDAFPTTGRRPIFEQGAMLQFFFLCDFLLKKDYHRLGDSRITIVSRLLKLLLPVIIFSFVGMMLSPMLVEVLKR